MNKICTYSENKAQQLGSDGSSNSRKNLFYRELELHFGNYFFAETDVAGFQF